MMNTRLNTRMGFFMGKGGKIIQRIMFSMIPERRGRQSAPFAYHVRFLQNNRHDMSIILYKSVLDVRFNLTFSAIMELPERTAPCCANEGWMVIPLGRGSVANRPARAHRLTNRTHQGFSLRQVSNDANLMQSFHCR